jgi:hypothetical protein
MPDARSSHDLAMLRRDAESSDVRCLIRCQMPDARCQMPDAKSSHDSAMQYFQMLRQDAKSSDARCLIRCQMPHHMPDASRCIVRCQMLDRHMIE